MCDREYTENHSSLSHKDHLSLPVPDEKAQGTVKNQQPPWIEHDCIFEMYETRQGNTTTPPEMARFLSKQNELLQVESAINMSICIYSL